MSAVPSHVALLRGINVGGRNRVSMEDLRGIVGALGHSEVSTYIQSGNILFTSSIEDSAALASELEHAIAQELEIAPQVVVLSRAELAEAIAANPFAEEPNPKYVHAVFHQQPLGPERAAEAAAAESRAAERGSADRARVAGRTLYLHTPEGIGRSDLATRLTRPSGARRADAGTARNMATVVKLFELLGA
jgi:uncharacterized protein (DUF1697 family)